jgi:hypothetical protein
MSLFAIDFILNTVIKPIEISNENVNNSEATCSHWFLDCEFFYPEDGGDTFLRNVGSHKI